MEKIIAKNLLAQTHIRPKVGIILGTGFASVADKADISKVFDTAEIEGYPRSTVLGHGGKILFGTLGGADIVIFSGRLHYYEGYSTYETTLPVRIMKELGCKTAILTNAAGAINNSYSEGDFVIISDHICNNLDNPLRGNGYKFVDMCNAYDKSLREAAKGYAKEINLKINEGVYIFFSGPSFETPAEIKSARSMGADLVGMSTVAETIMARYLAMRVLAISFVSNMAACDDVPLDHETFASPDKEKFAKIASLIQKVCINQ